MNYRKIPFVLFFVLFTCAVAGQTIESPFTITVNTFDELDLKNEQMVNDKDGKEYKVINTSLEKGLLINDEGTWKKHGKYFRYTSGKLTQVNTYKLDIKHGKEIRYFQDGKKNWEYEYSDGEKNGPFILIYQKNGQTCQEGIFKNGKKEGEETYYYETGIKKQIKTYLNGKVIKAIQYDSNGEKISENSY